MLTSLVIRKLSVASSPDIQLPLTPSEEFVQLFSRIQRRLYLHILKQVGSPNDAEEILQETNVVIWNKFHRFELGTNFVAWSFQIANFEVLKYRDRKRSNKLVFSGDLLEVIAQESEEQEDDLDLRRAALQECLQNLRSADRELIQQRYQPGNTGEGVARQLDRPINSVYQSIGRIRKTLFECINRRLAAGSPR
ncbi:MAG: sigma-70 family RNA polymerase sigma factor [Planctomycetaceae bacterium]|jgi:RNA polymerase sigma-70 factor (ECF subfamily)|nr:sigma-70 family RNA polymerase sigma factor [Planctomycetaceae bacterium]